MSEKNTTVDMEFDGKKFTASEVQGYSENYSDKNFFDKVTGVFKKAGLGLIYKALQLYYVAQRPDCPLRIKAAVYAPLGYFISPIDAIPDITPVIGYTDDAAVIAAALMIAQFYINDDVKRKAREKIESLFGKKAVEGLK